MKRRKRWRALLHSCKKVFATSTEGPIQVPAGFERDKTESMETPEVKKVSFDEPPELVEIDEDEEMGEQVERTEEEATRTADEAEDGDKTGLIRNTYKRDAFFNHIMGNVDHYKDFMLKDGLLYMTSNSSECPRTFIVSAPGRI